ncbi:hypothetical protein EV702DRAFT_1044890 [Suillus placidus]|uniref:Uncharacterized protein n=1 Tax=Suillus placidus TaxID=48579 RepID=A0A9P6ZW27_9AGAM|nr:hypothetical protein EV702DRAFT_1044890 [Suillus placidus]
MSNHNFKAQRCIQASKQRVATERWFAKPGVRDAQNAKACVRMARKKNQAETLPTFNFHHVTPELDDSVLMMENDIPCSCDVQTLQTIAMIVNGWRKEWKFDSEATWNKVYGEREGRAVLDSIGEVVHMNCACCRECLKYDIILLHDLLVHVTAEVKFLERQELRTQLDRMVHSSKHITHIDSEPVANSSKCIANDGESIANDSKSIANDSKSIANDGKSMANQ